MIGVDLFVNGEKLDMFKDANVSLTIQANKISELKDRQTSYTDSFDLPKTSNNIQIFNGLGLPSSTSRTPYQKPACQLRIMGFNIVRDGWINVKETDDVYKVHVYFGVISFFKSIENKFIGDMDISVLNHKKDITKVTEENPNYRYFVCSYNGKTHIGDNFDVINIDYLQPSASVSYLWDKIHEDSLIHGNNPFKYKGSVFDSEDFKSLYITYPKAVDTEEKGVEYLKASGEYHKDIPASGGSQDPNVKYGGSLLFQNGLPDGVYRIQENGRYRIRLKLKASTNVRGTYIAPQRRACFYFTRNHVDKPYSERRQYSTLILSMTEEYHELDQPWEFAADFLEPETISFFSYFDLDYFRLSNAELSASYEVEITKVESTNIDFTEGFKDFLIHDFVKEILYRFGLTMFYDEKTRTVEYLTIDERVNQSELEDWTDYYISRDSETYVLNDYAQKNNFSYQYNDKEQTNKNGYIGVDNLNLNASKNVISSKTYAPDFTLDRFYVSPSYSFVSDVFRFYDREVNDKGEIKYKPLQKRFFFIKGKKYEGQGIVIGSGQQKEKKEVDYVYIGSFSGLDWQTVISDYYAGYKNILNSSVIHSLTLNIPEIRLLNLDLKKLYYFKQEQQYYFINRIKTGRSVTAEMVRVKFSRSTFYDNVSVAITWVDDLPSDAKKGTATALIKGNIISGKWQVSINGGSWTDLANLDLNYAVQDVDFGSEDGKTEVRIIYETKNSTKYSNVLEHIRQHDATGCYDFELKSPDLSTRTVTYTGLSGKELKKELSFTQKDQRYTIRGKEIKNYGGCTLFRKTTIDCQRCISYKAYYVGDFFEHGTVGYKDCEGEDRIKIINYQGGRTFIFCALENTVTLTNKIELTENGDCMNEQ